MAEGDDDSASLRERVCAMESVFKSTVVGAPSARVSIAGTDVE